MQIDAQKLDSIPTPSVEFYTLRKQIKANLLLLESKAIAYPEERDTTFDEEIYCKKIARKIGKLLNFEEARQPLELNDFIWNSVSLFRFCAKTDDKRNIRIYNFGYNVNGSRAWVSHPIIQWTDDQNKVFTYNLSKQINCDFSKIYPLNDDLYLLIGDEPGSGACVQNIIYVIQFKGDYLILDYPAFLDRSYLNFCNVTFTFNSQTKILTAQAWEFSHYSAFNLEYEFEHEETRNKYYSFLAVDLKKGEFKLKFKNNKFQKTRKNNSDAFYGEYED
jgi:hypothetical protein